MNKKEYEKFMTRYEKFNKNNLPTPFWDEERMTLEYIYKNDSYERYNNLIINPSLTESLGDIALIGFYYSYSCKLFQSYEKDGKWIEEETIGHTHAHSFEEVVRDLYNYPESFYISKDEEQFYSKQELEYLRRVQKYLLFIGLKDLDKIKIPVSRYRNKKHEKYKNTCIYNYSDKLLDNIINKKVNFRAIKYVSQYPGDKMYEKDEYRALILDKDDNFKLFIEFTKTEIKKYKDIKESYKIENLKDSDKVIVMYFDVLEKY